MNLTQIQVLHDCNVYRIWRGEDQTANSRYLVKELTPQAKSSPTQLKRLDEEFEFLQRLRHERLLEMHAAPEPGMLLLGDAQYTLEQLIGQKGRQSNELVASILKQILEGLTLLNNNGFAHGSLAPSNVFVDPRGFVRLGDFAGYRWASSPPRHSPDNTKYLAPEIINSDLGKCSPSCDLYNLGFLALELLAADDFPALFRLDPQQTSKREWLKWHSSEHQRLIGWRQYLPEVSQALADFIDMLIEKRITDRPFASAAKALARLNELGLQSLRVLPTLDSPAEKKREDPGPLFRPPQRRPGPILILSPQPGTSASTIRLPPESPFAFSTSPADPPWTATSALLACQGKDWYLYSLLRSQQTFHNRKPVLPENPVKLRKGDWLRFSNNTAWIVDIEFQGTTVISSMDLQRRLHAGSGGDIYLAKWFRPDSVEDVAVRILPEEFGKDRDRVARFLRAVPVAAKLVHPNIVRLRHAGRVRLPDKSIWFLASDYMPHGSLRDYLRSNPNRRLGLRSVKRIAASIARALQAAARIPTVHRNINPSCILFDADDHVKLGDFTLARGVVQETMMEITRGKLVVGDYHYQSPEVLSESGELSFRSDLYSLAVCLYESLLGSLPFNTDESAAMAISRMIRYEWPSVRNFRSEIPQAWDLLLRRTLSREPADRCESLESFLADVQALPVS
jgi:serine/threonine protein kinase